MSVSKHTKRHVDYDATPRTPAQEKQGLYAAHPRPATVLLPDAEGRFGQVAGSALVYPDRVEIVQLTPEAIRLLSPEGRAALGEGETTA